MGGKHLPYEVRIGQGVLADDQSLFFSHVCLALLLADLAWDKQWDKQRRESYDVNYLSRRIQSQPACIPCTVPRREARRGLGM